MTHALRIVQRNALVYRRTWRGSLFFSFLQPTLFLVAMGVTLGKLVDRGGAALPGHVGFLQFLAPGMLAAACMQTAAFESSFPINGKMSWRRNYQAMMATPLRTMDLVVGELAWVATRLLTVATAFMGVMAAFGIPLSPSAWLAIPAAILTGLAFSASIMAYAATLDADGDFNVLFRFVLTPLFLFSGIFFPVTRLPRALQLVAWCTPLFHGVALVRDLTLNTLAGRVWLVHVAYLVGAVGIGVILAVRTFDRKLHV